MAFQAGQITHLHSSGLLSDPHLCEIKPTSNKQRACAVHKLGHDPWFEESLFL